MNLIFIYGFPGVGKLTVARELSKLTELPLFHNHLVVDLLLSLFEFGTPPFVELRERIWLDTFAEAAKAKLPSLIFTFAFDHTIRKSFINNVCSVMKASGGEVLFVELKCEEQELERRITDASRKDFGKLSSLEQYRELNAAGAFVNPGIPTGSFSIDVTTLPPLDAALQIAKGLQLPHTSPVHPRSDEASVREAYDNWSRTYDDDRNRTRDLDGVVTRSLLGELSFKSVIEVGCGTGKNTPLFSQIGEQVLSLDFSEAMLQRAHDKMLQSGITNVTFRKTDITQSWPCESASADLISFNLVLEHIEELGRVFAEAALCLVDGGTLFVSELHPFRQYEGTKARFEREGLSTEIAAFVHHASDFLSQAYGHGLMLVRMDEWWHEEDAGKPPRLITFMFEKKVGSTGLS